MSSILEELRKKREEEEKQRQQATEAQRILESATSANSYKKVLDEEEELKKKTQKALDTVNKLRIPEDPLSKKNQKIVSTVEEDYSRPAGDTMEMASGSGNKATNTVLDTVVGDVASGLANIKSVIMPKAETSDAERLLEYSKGNRGITNSLAFKRLQMTDAAKTGPVAILIDELERGTYKGTADDIRKTLRYGDATAYNQWYNSKVSNAINKSKETMETNKEVYGEGIGNLINATSNATAKILEFSAMSYLASPMAAGAMFGLTSDASQNVQKMREEGANQVAKDVGVDVGLGTLFSYLMGKGTGVINSAIKKAIPESVLTSAGIIARNVLAGAGGAYTSVGATGTLRNLYNLSQGREVTAEDMKKPWWSAETATATFMGALLNGINSIKEVQAVKTAKMENLSKLGELKEVEGQVKLTMSKEAELNVRLNAFSKDIMKQYEANNPAGVRESYENGKLAIEDFFKQNNLGAVTETLKNKYLTEWFNYNYDMGVFFENANQPAPDYSHVRYEYYPELTQPTTPTQSNIVVPPPSTYTPSAPLTNITNNNTITAQDIINAKSMSDISKIFSEKPQTKEQMENLVEDLVDYSVQLGEKATPLGKKANAGDISPEEKAEWDKIVAEIKANNEKIDYINRTQLPQATELTNITNNNIINPNQGGVINGQTNNQGVVGNVGLAANDNRGNIRSMQGQAIGEGPSRGNDMVSGRGETVVGQEGTIDDTKPSKEQETLTLGEFDRLINLYERLIEKDGENEHYQKAIEILKEGKEKWSSLDFTPKAAIERTADGLGTTEKFETAGFVLPDGRMTDLSGSKFGLSGKTRLNHYMVLPFSGYLRDDFIKETGSIRVYPEGGSVDISETVPPTEEQLKVLEKYFNYSKSLQSPRTNALGDYFYVDIMRKNRPNISFEIQKDIPSSTFIDILKDYFKTGKRPDDYNTYISEPDNLEYTIQNSTQGSFSMPKNLPEELPAERRKFLKEFKQVGYVNIKGVKVTSVDDLADVAQVFRDPIAETFRVIFMKGDTIVGQSGYTTGSVRAVGIGNNKRFAGQIDLWADGFGADSYYLIHNHPDGRVEPSSGDIGVTRHLANYTNIPLKGHIIIDHNEFSAIYRDGTTQKHIKLRNNTYNEIEKDFSKEGWANTPANNVDQIAALSSYVKNDKDFSTVIWTDSKFVPTVLQSLPNSFFEGNSKNKIVEYMQKVGRENGADYVMFATQKPSAFMDIKEKAPNTPAVVLYIAKDDGSLSVVNASRSQQLHLYNNNRKNSQQIAPMEGVQMKEPSTSLEEIKKQYETKQPEVKKEPPKKLEPPKKKEQLTKAEKKQPAKRLEKKQPEPDKRLGFDAVDKDKEALEKANDKLRDELAKQKKEYEERLKKKDEALEKFKQTKKEQKEKQKLTLKKKEATRKEEQRFKSATPKGKLRILGRRIEKQTGYYEINNYPELDKKYEEEFGKTIRQTIQTLKTRDIYPYLPAKFQDIVDTFADETYLKANWKTFDKYVKEALQIDEIKKLIEESDTPVADRLLGIIREHKTAPITIKTAKEMYEDLQILEDIVELAQERIDYRREPEGWKETVDKAGEELKEIAKENTPKSFSTTSAKLSKAGDNVQSLSRNLSQFKTRIQELFGGNPDSPFKRIWDEFQEGDEKKAMLDVLFSRNFDGLVEGKPGKYKMKGELQKDFSPNAKPIDTGIKGKDPTTGKEYEENAMLPKKIIMHIVASSRNDDNLMSFCKILLGTDYKGEPVYSNPGGYIVPDDYYLQRGNIDLAYKKGKKYVFTKQDIEHLEKLLTPEEKEFVDAALKVGDITAKYGNEVSQKLIGRDLFTVKNYIRIIRDQSEFDPDPMDATKLDNLANATSEKFIGIGGLLGRGGSLEGRNHRSTRPIYGESLKQSVTRSFGGATKYIAYALPLYDTDYLLKARLPDTFEQIETVEKEPKSTKDLTYIKVDELPRNGAAHTRYYMDNGDYYTVYGVKEKGETIKDLITKTGDKGFYDYYNQFVDSLVGKGKPYSKFASIRAKVVLNANLRVAATQFFSYFQMGQFLDHPSSSMLKAIADRGTIAKLAKDFLEKDGKDLKGLKGQEIVNRFIEYVSYKNSQRGLGMFSDDVRYVEMGNSVLGRVNTGRLMAIVDKFTVDATYRALMYDIMAEGKEFGSKEFMDEFKSRLYAVYQSNPMYGEIYKTPLQNSTSEFARALSQFQTVMFEGLNNGKQAKMAYEYYKEKGDKENMRKYKKRFWNYTKGLLIGSLSLVAMKDYVDRLMGKESDEEYAKKITLDFISNLLSYTIIGDEIFEAILHFNDYDLTTNELSYFNSALDALGDLASVVGEPKPPKIIKAIKSLGQALGLPANSMENIFGLIGNLSGTGAFKAYAIMKDKNKYNRWLKYQDEIDGDFVTFYDISQVMSNKVLAEKYEWVKGSKTNTYNSKGYAKARAIKDVLGIPVGKNMTDKQEKEFNRWYNVFKD